ncbi:proteasome maturation factor UMP1-domain-containing protein [Calycina marina]|uniref:Proteasome maturation factor UMP1-domain-containing protein n=1 Tax=Calycina marina TaxID=1763456 RepID=A0A9P7Z8I4_9HELO|nr:proteasome maturation factor UMP1-domain-containing protein [Calycina marina]
MAMRIVPVSNHRTSHSHLQPQTLGAPSAPGLYDTLRAGVGPTVIPTTSTTLSSLPDSAHPLEARLKAWQETQDTAKMEGLRRTFGIAEPIRRGMELKITREGSWRPAVLGGGNRGVHEDILMGNDCSIQWEDVFMGEEMRGVLGFHDEVEKKVRMQ